MPKTTVAPVEGKDFFIHRTRRLNANLDRIWVWGYSAYSVMTEGDEVLRSTKDNGRNFSTKAEARAAALASYVPVEG